MGRNRASLRVGYLALLFATALSGCAGEPSEPQRPNFVLLSVDTLNRDELRAFDPEAQPLPHLDRFADDAVRFSEAFSTAGWTLPAQSSILTGLYPHHHGAVHREVTLGPDVPTLAEALRSNGYQTVGFTHGGFVGLPFGLGRGFDVYDHHRLPRYGLSEIPLPREGRKHVLGGVRLFDRAIAFLDHFREGAPPFFLFVQTYNVHDYFLVRPWIRRPENSEPPDPVHHLECLLGQGQCTDEVWNRLESYYRAEIRYLDRAFGRLLEALDSPRVGPTYVLVVSDHGEGFDPERGRTHHGGRLHDDLIRVPMLLSGPNLDGTDVTAPVSVVDIAPTILELAGIEPAAQLDGQSLLTPLRHPSPKEPRNLYATEHNRLRRWGNTLVPVAAPSARPTLAAVISGPYRLITSGSEARLYHIPDDPREETDVSSEMGAVTESLRAVAQELFEHERDLELLEPSPELERQLRALGYL